MKKAFYLVLTLTIVGMLVAGCAQPAITEEQPVAMATKHLQKYGHYPPVVLRVEVEEGEGEANDYWSRFGQPPIQFPAKRPCLVGFVDKKSGEAVWRLS